MADAPAPLSVDEIGERPFSFYPPILNIEHNEWRLQKSSWSEVLVRNSKTDLDLWIPRTWLGDVSKVDEPAMIVGLRRELEYKGGTVTPHSPRVIGMPAAHSAKPLPVEQQPKERSSALDWSSSEGAESSVAKALLGVLAVGILVAILAVGFSRWRTNGDDVRFQPVVQAELGLDADSDYYDVVRILGQPDEDRWRPNPGERQYRALEYRSRGLTILLMGADHDNTVRYIGAKDEQWRNVHSVQLPGGGDTEAMLRSLEEF